MSYTSVSVADSPLANALDWYYSFLVGITKGYEPGGDQKLLINNTIMSFDIAQDTKYFNDGLFRNFADRVFYGSPQSIGPANRADRFSQHYEQIVRIAGSKIDRQHPEILTALDGLSRQLDERQAKLVAVINDIAKDWASICAVSGLKPSDPNYDLKYISYLESVRYADRVGILSMQLDDTLGQMDAVRRAAYTPAEQTLLDAINELTLSKKVARPLRPSFERTVANVNDLTFADPTVRIAAICDISPAAYPVGDLIKFLQVKGPRRESVTKTFTAKYQHDKEWSAGGNASFSFFGVGVSGGAGGSGSSSYIKNISETNGMSIGFENIDEILVDREMWFNPAVFQDAGLLKVLETIPGLDRLQYVSVSLIIGRGLTLSLTFDQAVDETSWSKQAFQASGGVSVFGYSFGASGSTSTYDYSFQRSTDNRTVTFADDPQLARVLAIRVEPFVALKKKGATVSNGAFAAKRVREAHAELLAGKRSYLDFQAAKFE